MTAGGAPPRRCWRRTGRAARRCRRAASTRTSGAGTRPTSRSAGRGSTPRGRRPSSSRCCAGQWEDGRVPHIVFHPGRARGRVLPGPGVLGAATATLRASRSRRCTRGRRWRSRERGAGDDVPAPRVRPRWPRSTSTSPGGATRAAAGWRRSCTRGSPGSTTARPGTRRWPRSSCRRSGVEPYERQDRRHVDPQRAAERRRLRPLRPPRPRLPRPRLRRRRRAARSSSRTRCSTRSGCGRRTRWPRSRSGSARTPGRSARPRRGIHAALLDAAVGRRALPRRATCVAGRLVEPRTILGARPAARPRPAGRRCATRSRPSSRRRTSAARAGIGVASSDLLGPSSSRRRYWRGPVWANLNWLLGARPARPRARRAGRRARAHDRSSWSSAPACASTSTR